MKWAAPRLVRVRAARGRACAERIAGTVLAACRAVQPRTGDRAHSLPLLSPTDAAFPGPSRTRCRRIRQPADRARRSGAALRLALYTIRSRRATGDKDGNSDPGMTATLPSRTTAMKQAASGPVRVPALDHQSCCPMGRSSTGPSARRRPCQEGSLQASRTPFNERRSDADISLPGADSPKIAGLTGLRPL
jgi:hypothetical protein